MKTDNELIAEFMGGKWETVWCGGVETKAFNFPGWHITDWPHTIHDDTFLYHKSWDWLMPVVEKIHSIGLQDSKIPMCDCYKSLLEYSVASEIIIIYRAVVEFINCNNQNKEQHESTHN